MKSAKMATLGFLKIKVFEIKIVTLKCLSITSPRKFYPVSQIIL